MFVLFVHESNAINDGWRRRYEAVRTRTEFLRKFGDDSQSVVRRRGNTNEFCLSLTGYIVRYADGAELTVICLCEIEQMFDCLF